MEITPREEALRIGNAMYNGDVFKKTKLEHLQELENAKLRALFIIDEKIQYHESLFDKGFKDVHIALSSPIKTYLDIMNPMLKYLQEVKREIEKL